jgi:hypothetical protein
MSGNSEEDVVGLSNAAKHSQLETRQHRKLSTRYYRLPHGWRDPWQNRKPSARLQLSATKLTPKSGEQTDALGIRPDFGRESVSAQRFVVVSGVGSRNREIMLRNGTFPRNTIDSHNHARARKFDLRGIIYTLHFAHWAGNIGRATLGGQHMTGNVELAPKSEPVAVPC